MFDLDNANAVKDFVVKWKGETKTYDTIEIISVLAKENVALVEKGLHKDPAAVRDVVSRVFGLEGINAHQAMLISKEFDDFASQFENELKNVFGPSQSQPTTSDSAEGTTKGSQTNNDTVSSSVSVDSKPSEQLSSQAA